MDVLDGEPPSVPRRGDGQEGVVERAMDGRHRSSLRIPLLMELRWSFRIELPPHRSPSNRTGWAWPRFASHPPDGRLDGATWILGAFCHPGKDGPIQARGSDPVLPSWDPGSGPLASTLAPTCFHLCRRRPSPSTTHHVIAPSRTRCTLPPILESPWMGWTIQRWRKPQIGSLVWPPSHVQDQQIVSNDTKGDRVDVKDQKKRRSKQGRACPKPCWPKGHVDSSQRAARYSWRGSHSRSRCKRKTDLQERWWCCHCS